MPRVITANVNGIRAALKRGGIEWLSTADADVICLQEVRATTDQLTDAIANTPLAQMHLVHAPSDRLGHSGVAILSRLPVRESDITFGDFSGQGRWAQATLDWPTGDPVTIVSSYIHTGEAEGPKCDEKHRFLEACGEWLAKHDRSIVTGDFNVARSALDIKNWRGNRGKAGFLESERAHLDRWFSDSADAGGLGWRDLGREFGGDTPGPYTWWSWRGKGFDTDGGWRIDYIITSPDGPTATHLRVVKAPSYAERWSDHAPVVADFVA